MSEMVVPGCAAGVYVCVCMDDVAAMSEMVVPRCAAGGLILWDFRLLHRGMPNTTGRERPMAHAILSTGLASDQLHRPGSLQAAHEALSAEPDGTRRQQIREAASDQQREAWLAYRASSAR